MTKRYTEVGIIMRLSGFVTVNGVRVGLNWSVTGNSVSAGPGLGADEVKVHIPLPDYTNTSGTLSDEAVPSDNPTGGYWDMTVTDLRLLLKEIDLPIYGNKQDLITRLTDSKPFEPDVVPALIEDVVVENEVSEDGAGSE